MSKSYNNRKEQHRGERLTRFKNAQKSCEVCGSINDLEIHHIVSVKNGGDSKRSNLIRLCQKHHFYAEYIMETNQELEVPTERIALISFITEIERHNPIPTIVETAYFKQYLRKNEFPKSFRVFFDIPSAKMTYRFLKGAK